MGMLGTIRTWWSRGGGALAERIGQQRADPNIPLVSDSTSHGPDAAMQISAVWACIDRRATVISSLPFFTYLDSAGGQRELARGERLYQLLHDSPNSRMTPMEFWRAMMLNHDLRGNAYARVDRDARGEPLALWPMPADQVAPYVLDDGAMAYTYTIGNNIAILADENVLHLKNLGNGTVGLAKLEFMRATIDEAARAQTSASKIFGNGGKPTGLLMIDKVLKAEQRKTLLERFSEMSIGSTSRLFVLEADLKYQQLSMSPEDQQLLASRQYGIEEICRWFDVPPILAHHSVAGQTMWGSGVEQVIDGWYKLSVRPMLVSIEQAVRKRVMSARERASMTVEFSLDALLRASAAARAELYAKQVQNGLKTRNEVRQLENDAPDPSPLANQLTVQSNLVPLSMLGQMQPTGGRDAPAQEPVAQ
jgi:HK97 family phage portal protein